MPKANLDKLLELLDEEVIARVIGSKHIAARENYTVQHIMPQNEDDLWNELARFYQHQIQTTTGNTISDWMAKAFVRKVIERKFSGDLEEALKIASKGIKGGMKYILDTIFSTVLTSHEDDYISSTFMDNLEVCSSTDKIALMTQFLNKYTGYIPPGTQTRTAVELASNKPEDLVLFIVQTRANIRSRIGR